MKKILVIHNKYQVEGGEEIAVQNEINLLKQRFEIETLFFDNFIDNPLKQFFFFLINRNLNSTKQFEQKLKSFKPDIVYIHNTWFKASIGIFNVLKNKDYKVLIKLHNFRYNCTKSYLRKKHFNNKNYCDSCGLNKTDAKFFNKYFKDSYLKSFLAIRYGRKLYKLLSKDDFQILVLTEFHKKFLKKNNVTSKSEVFPNYLDSIETHKTKNENYLVYAGRISDEKGVEELILSFLSSDLENIKLKIIGEGPIYKKLKNKYVEDKIDFLGQLSNDETKSYISLSLGVVTATKLYEGQPTLLCEASVLNKPSIFPDTGGISEFFPDNYPLIYKQHDYLDLQRKINMLSDKELVENIGNSNKEYINKYLDPKNLLDQFSELINE